MMTPGNATFVLTGWVSLLTACWAQPSDGYGEAPHGRQSRNNIEYRDIDVSAEPRGLFGPYPIARDAAGTGWRPDSSPLPGNPMIFGVWSTMHQGSPDVLDIYLYLGDFQQGSMQSLQVRRLIGRGTLGLRVGTRSNVWERRVNSAFLSITERTGEIGFPSGRQSTSEPLHLSAFYSWPLTQHSAMFGYASMPGEAPLDPARSADPLLLTEKRSVPAREHWLDPTGVSSGVVTVGYVWRNLKLEGSSFGDRKQEDERLITGSPRPFGMKSGRLSFNPTANLALQISRGQRNRPDQISPNDEIRRTTISAIYNRSFERNNWQTTMAFGRGSKMAAGSTNAYLLESVFKLANVHTYFGRFERASNDELFTDSETLYGRSFSANRFTLGYVYEFASTRSTKLGIGALASKRFIPSEQYALFGRDPASYKIFIRVLMHYQ
jgi:hypothetical protein